MTPSDRSDPRLRDEYVKRVSGTDELGDAVLIGVVHDHPASKYRAKTIIEAESPAVLALELPPFAVPLFEAYATDSRTPPAFGGEMSIAIQAASTDRVLGIDGPTPAFFTQLGKLLFRERASLAAITRTAKSALSMTKDAVLCRCAATVAAWTGLRVEIDTPTTYETTWNDEPAKQAADEHSQVTQANAMLQAFDPPPTANYRASTRERHMASRLIDLRKQDDVVAVIGMGHLDAVATRIADGPGTTAT